jgi:sulfur carrier protein ThiS
MAYGKMFILMNIFIWRYSMKIQIESLGLPTLSKLIGKTSQVDMADGTVADIVSHIVNQMGQPARKILLDRKGRLDLSIQVMVNDEGFLPRNEYSQRVLKDGDKVKFMLLVGGG